MIWKCLGKSAVNCERTAPLTVLLTVCDKGRVLVEAVDDSLEETVLDVVHLHLRHWLACGIEIVAALAGNLLDARVLLHRHVDIRLGVAAE